jgi:hypothetical protein
VGFLDAILGRTKLPKADEDGLFALGSAVIGLQAAAELVPAGRSAIIFKGLPAGRFDQEFANLRDLLKLHGEGTGIAAEEYTDQLGYEWIILSGDKSGYSDSLAAIHTVATGLIEDGLGGMLLACVFRFEQRSRAVYWIYGYKQASWYPFLPVGPRQRDNAEELRLSGLGKNEGLPVEPNLGRWYALWGLPV